MTYAEYEKVFSEKFRRFSNEPTKEETEAFLRLLIEGNHVKKQFIDDMRMADLRGDPKFVDPVTFASWAVELYPEDFKDPVSVDETGTLFSGAMNFTGVREK